MARIVLALVAASLFLAAPAQAAVTPNFANSTLTVTMSANGDSAAVRVSGGKIVINDVPHATATTANVNSISWQDTSGTGGTTAILDLSEGTFAPGQTDEAGASDEIEFFASLGQGTDEFVIKGAPGGDRILMGSSGINLNPEEGDGPALPNNQTKGVDVDITSSGLQGVESVRYEGTDGPDLISAAGGTADDQVGTTGFTIALKLNGAGGDDELTGGNTSDTLDGAGGNDRLLGGSGDDTITGGVGNDRLEGQIGNDSLDGQEGDDEHLGAEGNDTLHNSAGNDLLDGGTETVFITGDVLSHVNFYVAHPEAGGLDIDLADGGAQDTGAGIDTITEMEDVLGSSRDDVLKGDNGGNLISGGEGNDIIETRAGQDRLFGGPGDDRLNPGGPDAQDTVSGDDGRDIVDYSTREDAVIVQLGSGTKDGSAGSGETAHVLKTIEGAIGGSGDDTLLGGDNEDYLEGGPGADQLQGGAGNDTLNARDGKADALNCGGGHDAYDADAEDDVGPSCERPYSLPGENIGPAGDKAPALRLSIKRKLRAKKGVFTFRATCPRSSINRCRGTATVSLKKKTVAVTRFDIPLGATRSIRMKLSKSAVKQLKRKKKLSIILRVTSRDDGGVAPSRSLKLTLRR